MARSEEAQRLKKLREAADDVKLLRISVEEAAQDHGVDAEDLYRVVHGMRPKTKSEREEMEKAPKTRAEVAAKKEQRRKANAEPEKQQGKRKFVDAGSFVDWEEVDEIPPEIRGPHRRASPWLALLETFVKSGKACVRREFGNTDDAKKACNNLSRFIREHKMPVKVYCRIQTVYIKREDGQ